jgi:hypothetical protein
LAKATTAAGRASRTVAGSSPRATRNITARETATSKAGSSGKLASRSVSAGNAVGLT